MNAHWSDTKTDEEACALDRGMWGFVCREEPDGTVTDARRNQIVVQDGVECRGVLASTIVGRKGGSREKESARWAAKGIDIGTVADAAPTQEQADKAGDDFLPQLTLRLRARLQ